MKTRVNLVAYLGFNIGILLLDDDSSNSVMVGNTFQVNGLTDSSGRGYRVLCKRRMRIFFVRHGEDLAPIA